MLTSDRFKMRNAFVNAWRRYQRQETLEPLEKLIAEIVQQHPEYHALLTANDAALQRDFGPESGQGNPFLHMGLHISLREQIGSDRPLGIRASYQQLIKRLGDVHKAEHQLMDCLGMILWEAQRAGRLPDEQAYLACVHRLMTGGRIS
jgi:hypothetical protein